MINNYQFSDKFDARPVYKVIQKQFAPLRKSIVWDINDIYGISGHLNQHPRAAMKLRADTGRWTTATISIWNWPHRMMWR